MEKMKINQIIVVTDGRSNIGGDPIMASKKAWENDIVVSSIGIIGREESDESQIEEVQKIATKGSGEWELTYIENLSETLQMMTQKTVNKTLNCVVNKQLKEIIGSELEEIRPNDRNKFIEYIENLSDEITLKCCVLMDCSGSMKPKIQRARDSIIELMNSLQGRKGKSEIAIIAFPGRNKEMTNIISDFTDDIDLIKKKIYNMKASGTTPTAPAIYRAIEMFKSKGEEFKDIKDTIEEEKPLFEENIV